MLSALVTLYNPEGDVAKRIESIILQVDQVILCDNSLIDNSELFKSNPKIKYFFWGKNYALSKAFNKVLKDKEIKWDLNDFVIFFDQDSIIEQGHVQSLIEEYNRLQEEGYDVGCIGPIYFDLNKQNLIIPKDKKQISENSYIVPCIMTSSMLCKYGDLVSIGFWNEDIFLDLADWDLCWRLMQKEKLCIKTKAAVFKHALGFGSKKIGPIVLGRAAPIREYYQTRNSLYLLKKDYTPKKYKQMFIRNLTIRPILHCLFLDNKKMRLKYIIQGYKHYRKNYTGEWKNKI